MHLHKNHSLVHKFALHLGLLLAVLVVSTVDAQTQAFLVTNYGNDTVTKFDLLGNASLFANTDLNNPSGIAVDSNGNVFVANWGDSTIVEFTPAGTPTIFATAASGLNHPNGLAFDASGNLYVANTNSSEILKYAPNGSASIFSTGSASPWALAFDSQGDLFVGDVGGIVYKITPSANVSTFATAHTPVGLAFDSSGNLYVSVNNQQKIDEFSPSASLTVFATGLNTPSGMVFGPDGKLYVLDTGIKAFASDGSYTPFVVGQTVNSEGIAFVPEPMTVPLCLGLGTIAAAVLYRRRKVSAGD